MKKYGQMFDFSFVRNKQIYTNPAINDYLEMEFFADIKHNCNKMSDVK